MKKQSKMGKEILDTPALKVDAPTPAPTSSQARPFFPSLSFDPNLLMILH